MLKTTERKDVIVLSGSVKLTGQQKTSYYWQGRYDEDRELVFERAYEIEHTDWGEGVRGCVYRVHDREFRDLSCMKGETLRKFSDETEIRLHEDGTRFLFRFVDIPTFDSGDREWDSMEHIAVYRDSFGINLISCRHGYAIPRIMIYTGLTRSVPGLTKWLELLDLK